MPHPPDIGSRFDPQTDIPHRSLNEIKAEVEGALHVFVDRFNHDNETELTVVELQDLERRYSVHHVLFVMELYGAEFPAHLDDLPGESLEPYQGGWMTQWELEK